MLILSILIVNTLNQNSYMDAVKKCERFIRRAACPSCHKSCGMIKYGFYPRKFRSAQFPDQAVTIDIQRCRCAGCGATHSIFLLMMLPFFRITLPDAYSLLSAPDQPQRERLAIDLSMDDDSIRFVSSRYNFDWKDKITFPGPHSWPALAAECFSKFSMWFLKKRDMKRKLTVFLVPTYPSCIDVPHPLIM